MLIDAKFRSLWGVALFMGMGCSSDEEGSATEPASEDEQVVTEDQVEPEGAEGAEAGSEEGLGAAPDRLPVAGEGKERARIHGTLVYSAYEKGTVQLDAVVEVEGTPQVVANERYPKPGDFRLVIRGDHESVNLVVYVDLDEDGPTAGDLRYEYEGNPVMLAEGERIEGLVINVKDEDPATLEPETTGEVPPAEPVEADSP